MTARYTLNIRESTHERKEHWNMDPQYKSFVATGATDEDVAAWSGEHAKNVIWNNKERDVRLSDLSSELQEYMEDYMAAFVSRNRVVYHWFDVYDLEEERL